MNPVNESLAGYPTSWQNNAAGADTNTPQDNDSMLFSLPTSLPGELRDIKSVVRGFSLDPAWVNYTGLQGAPAPSPLPATLIDAQSISLVNDWTAIATVGRVLKLVAPDGTFETRTITASTYDSGTLTTTVEFVGAVNAQLSYVEFSALGSAADGKGAYPLTLAQLGNAFVVPANQGGTGANAASFPVLLAADLFLGQTLAGSGTPTNSGTIKLPITGSASGQVVLKWAVAGPFTLDAINDTGSYVVTWDTPFANAVYAMSVLPSVADVVPGVAALSSDDTARPKASLTVGVRRTTAGTIGFYLAAIALGA